MGSQKLEHLDPLGDPRWQDFVDRHPRSSAFHTTGWLRALKTTYGYEPIAFTTSSGGAALTDGVVFCIVRSWLIKPRLVSLPFSDHAEPLMDDRETLTHLLKYLEQGVKTKRWTSVELRPSQPFSDSMEWCSLSDGSRFALHALNLRPSVEQLFRGLNKDSTQRKIRKAVREGLLYEEGRSEEHLRAFFKLSVMTRRRKALPPPPMEWFRNILQFVGDKTKIRIARTRNGEAAGAILTLDHKDSIMFKYGASDARFHSLGTMPFLLWQAIEDAKNRGATVFDFGRSDLDHAGLIHFKDHFGAERTGISHKVFPAEPGGLKTHNWKMSAAQKVFGKLPEPVLILAGRWIYPHIG